MVLLHSHCDTRCTSKISDIFLRFLAKIPEVDKREEKGRLSHSNIAYWNSYDGLACDCGVRTSYKLEHTYRQNDPQGLEA